MTVGSEKAPQLRTLFRSHNVPRVVKYKGLKWAEQVARMGEVGVLSKKFTVKPTDR